MELFTRPGLQGKTAILAVGHRLRLGPRGGLCHDNLPGLPDLRPGGGPGAVREALSRLSSECLVIAEPQRGFRAAPISEEDLVQLLEARKEIERLCLHRAMGCGDAGAMAEFG